ncbi:hypothetical protein HL658_03435 [Azospirillum sp. RWY-5-1]|uniref:ATP-grasp fold RimK-type domain-containing protein n=1 Tax=Azospirillum oleiclasticum TaxID=2735135 RepID=A0ABX2T370_9PROT|nr:hypothetical protein [Azospirillum oleiclasticum]NYZ11589.1 hypothetical protein [Azospirillum oleiclasticum]NYZ18750.1 hypothetical protein [Azospirillum oleiclasticum]
MILFITTSYDATVDLLIDHLEDGQGFRLNYDLWQDYSLEFTARGWRACDPVGRSITSETVTGCFWWKAFHDLLSGTDQYVVDEIKYHLREVYGWCLVRGLTAGNPPDFHNRMGKLNILQVASRYFPVPQTVSGWNLAELALASPVAKSLSSTPTEAGRVMYAQAVQADRLDLQFPWTLQERVDAEFDVTVFLCGVELFAFRRSRRHLQGLDWRVEVFNDAVPWVRFDLSGADSEALLGLSRELGVRFGRYDFLMGETGLSFLEFNANGQWGFLDPGGEIGLARKVLSLIRAG